MLATIISLVLLLCRVICAQEVDCTVGTGGTYATIQQGLNGCNGGAGSIRLIIFNGEYTENLVVSNALANVTLVSNAFILGLVAAQPTAANMTVFVVGYQHTVLSPSTSLFFQGIAFDGDNVGEPFFTSRLINNNLTLDRCLVTNFTGNVTLAGEGCVRGVTLLVINCRFMTNWGSSLYFSGQENIDVENNIFAQCGGYNNYSAVYVKLSFVSTGIFVFINNSHWLLADEQPPLCVYLADVNGMTQCFNNSLYCYNTLVTQQLRPNCHKVQITYTNENTHMLETTMDYPQSCRIYRPCTCQDLQFYDTRTQNIIIYPIGDMYVSTLHIESARPGPGHSLAPQLLLHWPPHQLQCRGRDAAQ